MYFYAFRSISAIVFGGFFANETTNSLDFNPALKVVSCTLSSATSNVSRVKRFTYDLRVSFCPCLMVSKWFAGLLGCCPPMKWHKKELPNCSKLSMDDVGNFVNHSLTTPLKATREWLRMNSTIFRQEAIEGLRSSWKCWGDPGGPLAHQTIQVEAGEILTALGIPRLSPWKVNLLSWPFYLGFDPFSL